MLRLLRGVQVKPVVLADIFQWGLQVLGNGVTLTVGLLQQPERAKHIRSNHQRTVGAIRWAILYYILYDRHYAMGTLWPVLPIQPLQLRDYCLNIHCLTTPHGYHF